MPLANEPFYMKPGDNRRLIVGWDLGSNRIQPISENYQRRINLEDHGDVPYNRDKVNRKRVRKDGYCPPCGVGVVTSSSVSEEAIEQEGGEAFEVGAGQTVNDEETEEKYMYEILYNPVWR